MRVNLLKIIQCCAMQNWHALISKKVTSFIEYNFCKYYVKERFAEQKQIFFCNIILQQYITLNEDETKRIQNTLGYGTGTGVGT